MSNVVECTSEPGEHPAPELTLTHLDTLPTLSPIAVKLLQITSDSDSSAKDVVEALRGDQSLTAKILSVANSPIMGAGAKISTLDRAVVLLGFKAVRGITLAVKVFEAVSVGEPREKSRHFDRAEFWKHSLGVASAARRLAARRRELNVDPEEAFVAGLLHDLGKVALEAVFPRAYERAAAKAEETRCDISDCERTLLGVDHTVAGRHLAKRWGLPRNLLEVIWLHHVSVETLSGGVESPGLIGLVQLANMFVREQRIGYSGDFAFHESSARLAETLGFEPAHMDELAPNIVADVAEYATLLGLDRETPEAMYLKSLTRANDELGRLNVELMTSNRRLAAAARYFEAITQFDRLIGASVELAGLIEAIAATAAASLQRGEVLAFGIHDQRTAVELCLYNAAEKRSRAVTRRVDEDLRAWLDDPGETAVACVVRAPLAIRSLLLSLEARPDRGECWLLPIVHDGRIAAGVVFMSEQDECAELARERDELQSFLASLGLAVGRANAQSAARRLADSLAESNRRLQHMQAELLRTRALSMIAEMAAGAGHELNSPLTVISGRAQMLANSVEDPETRRTLEQIHEKAHECARIVTELMDFARPHPPETKPTGVAGLLASIRQTWIERAGLTPSRLAVDEAAVAPEVRDAKLDVDPDQVRAVFDAMIENAIDAISESSGSISITWREGAGDQTNAIRGATPGRSEYEPAAGRWIEIVLSDTGCGMSPATVQRVFDPFFSHRRAGRGRGLGLARAHRIIEAHGGRVWVISQPGEETSFHVVLPRVSD